MEAQALTPQRVVAELTRSPHGDLNAYIPVGTQAVREMPEFFAHLIAWNHVKGAIRDSKVALPVVSLMPGYPFAENSLAHLALLDPKNLARAVKFAKTYKTGGRGMRKMIERYLRARESNQGWFIRSVLQHRASMKELYAVNHVRPHTWADAILFKGARPPGPLAAVAGLKDMSAKDAAFAIVKHRIPFLIAVGALGKRMKEPELVLALMEQMSPAELINNTKMLEGLGVKTEPMLRAAYEAGLQRVVAATGTKSAAATLKTTRAVQAISDEKIKAKLNAVQDKQIKAAGIEGDWLVLGDKSGSMHTAIEVARVVAATLAKYVKGQVNLVWFDTMPRAMNVTGKSYEQILAETKHVRANGGTSIGCGLQWAIDKGVGVQGIAIVSDGGENSGPMFRSVYERMSAKDGTSVPVYFYRCDAGDSDSFSHDMKSAGHDVQLFDLGRTVDMYSLPNLVATMRASRYSLFDEIMEQPLLTLDQVFKVEGEQDAA